MIIDIPEITVDHDELRVDIFCNDNFHESINIAFKSSNVKLNNLPEGSFCFIKVIPIKDFAPCECAYTSSTYRVPWSKELFGENYLTINKEKVIIHNKELSFQTRLENVNINFFPFLPKGYVKSVSYNVYDNLDKLLYEGICEKGYLTIKNNNGSDFLKIKLSILTFSSNLISLTLNVSYLRSKILNVYHDINKLKQEANVFINTNRIAKSIEYLLHEDESRDKLLFSDFVPYTNFIKFKNHNQYKLHLSINLYDNFGFCDSIKYGNIYF